MPDLPGLREEYDRPPLRPADFATDPIAQFESWFAAARNADLREPNAMTLATAAPDGTPSARTVLLKGVDADGFVFFTNYRSRKGRELDANPHAALVFWWQAQQRQVRIEGTVERLPAEASDVYFRSRPRASRLGAWASPQSEIVEDRAVLDAQFEQAAARFEGEEVSCPSHWGGYRLTPAAVEFWQGRPGRLHDRLRYRRTDDGPWHIERLAP